MEWNSNLSNYSDSSTQVPVISDGTAEKQMSQFFQEFPTIRPFKYEDLSDIQIASLDNFECGNSGIDTFLRHGDGLKFNTDRNKMYSMIMATETQVLGYMAYSKKEATFYVPKHCSPDLYHQIGLKKHDEILVIHYLGVDKSCQGKGLGRALAMKALDFGLKHAKSHPNLRLLVLHATPEACSFYENLGFHRIGKTDDNLVEYAYTLVE
jgi:ribosomal protein S18 acetylase RimI-like enzyme